MPGLGVLGRLKPPGVQDGQYSVFRQWFRLILPHGAFGANGIRDIHGFISLVKSECICHGSIPLEARRLLAGEIMSEFDFPRQNFIIPLIFLIRLEGRCGVPTPADMSSS
jgi:hypothetical protein